MRIAIAADGPRRDNLVEPVLGRADWFIIMEDGETIAEAVQNPHRDDRASCGNKVARMLADLGATVVLAGNYGPKASLACREAGLDPVLSRQSTVAEALARYLEHDQRLERRLADEASGA